MQTLNLVTAADEAYAAPLVTMVRSVFDRLSPGVEIDLFVLYDAFQSETVKRIEKCWRNLPLRAHWIRPDRDLSSAIQPHGHGGKAVAYFRIIIGSLLPQLEKAIYLDPDVLVLDDLLKLWQTPMAGRPVLAVQDALCHRLQHALTTVPKQLHQTGPLPYFNSGVIVADLNAWREEDLELKVLDAASRHREISRWWDQDALNLALASRWGALPPRWNAQTPLSFYPDWRASPYSETSFRDAVDDPAIIHFTTPSKPWHAVHYYDSGLAGLYYKTLRMAGWEGEGSGTNRQRSGVRAYFARTQLESALKVTITIYALRAGKSVGPLLRMFAKALLRAPWTIITVPYHAARGLIRRWIRS